MSENEITLKEHFEDKFESFNEKIEKVEERTSEKIDSLSENLILRLENIQTKLDQTYEQAKKTNGRVNKHDDKFNELDKVHYECPGAKALKEINGDQKDDYNEIIDRIQKQEKITQSITYFYEHPKVLKFVGILLIISCLSLVTIASFESIPKFLKLIVEIF